MAGAAKLRHFSYLVKLVKVCIRNLFSVRKPLSAVFYITQMDLFWSSKGGIENDLGSKNTFRYEK